MALTETGRLFDITTRLALFVENVKLGQMQEFGAVLAVVEEDLRKIFSRVKYRTLDGLSKAELNRLLLAMRKSQLRVYSAYTEKLIKTLQDFMQIRLDVSAVAYATVRHQFATGSDEELSEDQSYEYIEEQNSILPFAALFGLSAILPSGSKSLWSSIKNAPIPANGLYLLPFISTFSRSAQASVENTIRRAYANRQSVDATLLELFAPKTAQGFSSQFAKLRNQANAVIETSFAHVDQISAAAISSAIYSRYMWISVIDSQTTQFCIEHDKNIYRYGEGPIPPAHYKCRSTTVPLASQFDDFSPPTLYAWFKRQPKAVIAQFVGDKVAGLIDSGQMSSKEFASVVVGKPLDLNQFKSKTGLILST